MLMRLIGFEYKKIFKRKSTWISLMGALAVILLGGAVMCLGEVYVEGDKVYSQYEYIQMERMAGEKLSGEALDEKLITQSRKNLNEYNQLELGKDLGAENYKEIEKGILPSKLVVRWFESAVGNWAGGDIYQARLEFMKGTWRSEGLSEGEIGFHQRQNDTISTPLQYEYNKAYSRFEALQFTTLMFAAMVVVICVAPIFAEEYTTRVDALMLSSRYGRWKIAAAKIITGFTFAIFVSALYCIVSLLEQIWIYGMGNPNAPIQVMSQFAKSSFPVNIWQMIFALIMCGILSECMIAAVTMVCSAKMRSPFNVVIIGMIISVLPMFVGIIPTDIRSVHLLINALPGEFGNFESVFANQLLNIGGNYFAAYQYVPICYAVLMMVGVFIAGKGFIRKQA